MCFHLILAFLSFITGQSPALLELLFSEYPVQLSAQCLLALWGSGILGRVRGPSVSPTRVLTPHWSVNFGWFVPAHLFLGVMGLWAHEFVIVNGVLALLPSCSIFTVGEGQGWDDLREQH